MAGAGPSEEGSAEGAGQGDCTGAGNRGGAAAKAERSKDGEMDLIIDCEFFLLFFILKIIYII